MHELFHLQLFKKPITSYCFCYEKHHNIPSFLFRGRSRKSYTSFFRFKGYFFVQIFVRLLLWYEMKMSYKLHLHPTERGRFLHFELIMYSSLLYFRIIVKIEFSPVPVISFPENESFNALLYFHTKNVHLVQNISSESVQKPNSYMDMSWAKEGKQKAWERFTFTSPNTYWLNLKNFFASFPVMHI